MNQLGTWASTSYPRPTRDVLASSGRATAGDTFHGFAECPAHFRLLGGTEPGAFREQRDEGIVGNFRDHPSIRQ